MKGNLMKGKMKGHFRKGKKGTVHELEFILMMMRPTLDDSLSCF